MTPPRNNGAISNYRGLGTLLHSVRWMQHLLAIVAEILILISFAMAGMDVSLGGVLAGIPLIKVLWAAMFALGIDTAFALSWVPVRRCVIHRQWLAFTGNVLLAFCMSFTIFQPLAVQLFQQSLDLGFNQADASLGINIVFLTYARAGVAVFLGAILAITNTADEATTVKDLTRRRRRFAWPVKWIRSREPVLPKASITVNEEQPTWETGAPTESPITPEEAFAEQETVSLLAFEAPAQSELPRYDTPEQRAQKVSEIDFTGLSIPERVAKVLELFPDLSDRELGKLSGMAAATAKKHREALKVQAAKEGDQ